MICGNCPANQHIDDTTTFKRGLQDHSLGFAIAGISRPFRRADARYSTLVVVSIGVAADKRQFGRLFDLVAQQFGAQPDAG